jgi:phage shock protein A
MGGTPASFQPGDPDGRAAAAARKSRPGKRRKIEPSFLEKLKKRGPAALEAIDRMLAKNDPAAARIVIDRLAPKALVEDSEVVKALATLKDANDDLQRSMGDLQAELDAERVHNRELEAELQAARAEFATTSATPHKFEKTTHDISGNA